MHINYPSYEHPYAQSLRELPDDIRGIEGTLSKLKIFPGKALGGWEADQVRVSGYGLLTPDGLQDRAFMLGIKNKRANEPGQPSVTRFSQREQAELALVRPEWDGSVLRYSAPGMNPLDITLEEMAPRNEKPILIEVIPGEIINAVPENGPITARIRQFLAQFRDDINDIQAFLPWSQHTRAVGDRNRAGENAQTVFSDGGQVLLASKTSLLFNNVLMHGRTRKKKVALEGDVSMDAIRTNGEVSGWPPNVEDIAGLAIIHGRDNVRMKFGDLCIRCSVTMVDPKGKRRRDGEPIDTFRETRPHRLDDASKNPKPTFAVNTVFPESEWGKVISVGDAIIIESEKEVG